MEKFDPEKTIEARWVVDSESGYQYLLELATGRILAKWTAEHKHSLNYSSELSTRDIDVYECICGKTVTEFSDIGGGC